MKTIHLNAYRNVILESNMPANLYAEIKKIQEENNKIQIDFSNISTITPFLAKQVFGKLYLELGAKKFFSTIDIKNATREIELLIKIEIQNSIDEKCYQLVW